MMCHEMRYNRFVCVKKGTQFAIKVLALVTCSRGWIVSLGLCISIHHYCELLSSLNNIKIFSILSTDHQGENLAIFSLGILVSFTKVMQE